MIERQFVAQKTKEYYIKKYIEDRLKGVGISLIKLKKIPLGEKIIIHTSRPSLIVGSKGSNIRDLTKTLKKDFGLENPQIEINEVKDIFMDPVIVGERIASSLERFGSARFKGIAHKVIENVMNSGARGIEVVISGKIPGARAKSWRFYQGYLKKCGDMAVVGVRKANVEALLKTGIVGVKVSIMPPDLILPDYVEVLKEAHTQEGEVSSGVDAHVKEVKASSVKDEGKSKKKPMRKKEAGTKESKAPKKTVIKTESKNKVVSPKETSSEKKETLEESATQERAA
jgi:small subunit ribosomal protein S3